GGTNAALCKLNGTLYEKEFRNLRSDLCPSLAKEGATREPDRAKHKEMPRHQSDVPKAPFIGADGVVGSRTAHFIDQHHPVCAINGVVRALVCSTRHTSADT